MSGDFSKIHMAKFWHHHRIEAREPRQPVMTGSREDGAIRGHAPGRPKAVAEERIRVPKMIRGSLSFSTDDC